MPGDQSRITFDHKKHYSGVLLQQGRVLLDADWNEQVAIQLHRAQATAMDVIGRHGAPKDGGGFSIGVTTDGTDLTIAPGRIYVNGTLCELEAIPTPITFVHAGAAVNGNQAVLSTLVVDSVGLEAGRWVEISSSQKPEAKLVRIAGIDKASRIATFGTSIEEYRNAGPAMLRAVATYRHQKDYPHPPELSGKKVCLVYLDVWQREITANDDPRIREKALGGPDTTTRLKNVWQVQVLPVEIPLQAVEEFKTLKEKRAELLQALKQESSTASARWNELCAKLEEVAKKLEQLSEKLDCHAQLGKWVGEHSGSGTMNAQTVAATGGDLCHFAPDTRYIGLENQLYRVEVHKGGNRDQATFKWSRDNATVETKIKGINGFKVEVADLGKDEILGFAPGQWVEIIDEESTLKGAPNPLVQIDSIAVSPMPEITLKASVGALSGKAGLKLRRWDQSSGATADGLQMTQGWLEIEAGIQVEFSGSFRSGDYWLIPARTATRDIEWPPYEEPHNSNPLPQAPLGIRHHYCPLSLVLFDGVHYQGLDADCRNLFPPLTDITADDVGFDNSRCRPELAGAQTVQEAIEALCCSRRGGCALVAVPGPGWEAIFSHLPEDKNAHICLPAGSYPLDAAVTISGTVSAQRKGHLSISGAGPASRILAQKAEAALIFRDWESVTVHDLYAETGRAEIGKRPIGITGSLTFLDCSTVCVERVTARCATGVTRSAACLSIANAQPERREALVGSARVLHCDLQVGHQQVGVQFVNVSRILADDNNIRVYQGQDAPTLGEQLNQDSRYANKLRKELVSYASVVPRPELKKLEIAGSSIYFKTDPAIWDDLAEYLHNDAGEIRTKEHLAGYLTKKTSEIIDKLEKGSELPEAFKLWYRKAIAGNPGIHSITEKDRKSYLQRRLAKHVTTDPKPAARTGEVTLTLDNQQISFRTDPSLVSAWRELVDKEKPTNVNIYQYLKDACQRIISGQGAIDGVSGFAKWFEKVKINFRPVASQGIAVGGIAAHEVRIRNNSINGAMQGIHAGFSQRDPSRRGRDFAERLVISGNSVSIDLTPATVHERHGIFVGNCDSLLVENNFLNLNRVGETKLPIDGIRIFGWLDRMVIVRQNHISGFSTGIRITPIKYQANPQWLVADNLTSNAADSVIAPSSVRNVFTHS